MKAEVKEKWLKALRSGEYKQARQSLRNDDKFCCLGVLCDLHAKETGAQWDERECYCGKLSYPPDIVKTWAELSRLQELRLADLNDQEYWSFSEIANYIEKTL